MPNVIRETHYGVLVDGLKRCFARLIEHDDGYVIYLPQHSHAYDNPIAGMTLIKQEKISIHKDNRPPGDDEKGTRFNTIKYQGMTGKTKKESTDVSSRYNFTFPYCVNPVEVRIFCNLSHDFYQYNDTDVKLVEVDQYLSEHNTFGIAIAVANQYFDESSIPKKFPWRYAVHRCEIFSVIIFWYFLHLSSQPFGEIMLTATGGARIAEKRVDNIQNIPIRTRNFQESSKILTETAGRAAHNYMNKWVKHNLNGARIELRSPIPTDLVKFLKRRPKGAP
jgi:hypothetical protein